jgi:ketosteroid isomerase-like protein
MSQENVELAKRAYDAFERDDLDEFLTYVDPEVEWHSQMSEMEGSTHGHDAVRRWWANLFAVFPDWKPSIVGVRDVGDFVVIRLRGVGSGAASGVRIDTDLWQVAEIQHGRIVWYAVFLTEEEAREAVGLRE